MALGKVKYSVVLTGHVLVSRLLLKLRCTFVLCSFLRTMDVSIE